MSDTEDLNINIGSNPSGIESGSRAATAAINKVQQEANGLDRAFRALRSSIDPMFAAQDRFNQSLAQSSKLLAEGRISEAEYTASVNAATEALGRQAAAQLKGTAVASEAAAATRAAANAKVSAENAANEAILASNKISSTAKAEEEARLTLAAEREAKARIAIALREAKDREAAAKAALENIPSVNRNAQGRFISAESVAADRAAVAEEAANIAQLAQLDATAAAQKTRLAQRELTTREGASRRAVIAEKEAAQAAIDAAATSSAAAEVSAAATVRLSQAQSVAAASAIASAQEQAAADELVAKATQDKIKAAVEAALAEEAEAKAASEAAAANRAAEIEANKLAAAEKKLAEAEASRVASANRLKAALDPTFAAQQKYNQAINLANGLANSGHIDEATKLKAVKAAEDDLTEALKVGTGARISNKAATESLVLVHEALQHRWTRMAGSGMILSQALIGGEGAAGLLKAALSPLGLLIIGVTAAIGAFAVATTEGAIQQIKLQRALAVTGQYAGMTAGQIDEAAVKIASSTNTSARETETSLATIASSGRVTGQALITMGEITQRLSVLTGQSSKEIAADMVKMADDPTAAMKKLNDQYHFLTPTQEEHIRNLIEEGNKTQAVTDLAGAFNSALKSEQTELGGLAGFAHNAAVGLGDLWQSMMNIGKAQEPMQRLAEIRAKLAADHPGRGGSQLVEEDRGHGGHYSERAALMQEAADIQKKLDADQTKSHKSQLDKQAIDDRDALNNLETTTRTNHAKMLREQQAWRKEANELIANPEASAEDKQDAQYRLGHSKQTDAAVAKKYDRGDTPKPPAKGPSVVAEWATQLKQQEEASSNYFKDEATAEIAFWQDKLSQTTKGSKEWVEVQSKLYPLLKAQAHKSYEDQLGDLKEKIDAVEGNLTQEEAAWQVYLAKVKSVMTETSKEYRAAEKEYENYQKKVAELEVKKQVGAEKAAEKPVLAQQDTAKTNDELKGGAIDYEKSSGALSDKKAAEQKKALLAEELADELAFEQKLDDIRKDALEKELLTPNLAKDKIAEINIQIEELAATHEQKMTAIRNKGLLDTQKANQAVATATLAPWVNTANAMTSALGNSIKAGITGGINLKAAFLGIANSIENAWLDMGIKALNTWVLSLIQQKVATVATTAATTATHVAGQVAQTGATAAGTGARVAITTAGAATERSVNFMTTLKVVAGHAAKAAAGGYAALASIPIVGPVLGAAAAVATYAAVLAFGALTSARGGQAQVPFDGQITELHKDEMVLPAQFANPLRRQLLDPQPANDVGTSAATAGTVAKAANDRHTAAMEGVMQAHANGGGAQLHLHGSIIHNTRDLEAWFKQNNAAVGAGLNQYYRNGGRQK